MSTKTKIEWADKTWSPIIGCDKVSPGCDRCYAITTAHIRKSNPNPVIAEAFAGTTKRENDATDWTGKVNLLDERLLQPLGWRKPVRVFVNSMSDLFHKDVPSNYIAQIFAVMALTPRHTYQVLTKRHARMQHLLNHPSFHLQVLAWTARLQDAQHPMPPWNPAARTLKSWPLPNVWLGVSVENQKWTDIRIPALVDTPAAVRFISAEPLLGPVDLSKWVPPVSPVASADAPTAWADWTWPDWVPQPVRVQVEGFWDEKWGRGPQAWIANMHEQGAPAFGATVRMDDGFGSNPQQVTGRFVHAWNNIGRLVLDDGSFLYTSFGTKTRRQQQPINWVIVGGESGNGARAMHPNWARNLRDQCVNAAVPFLFKQHGEWGPAPFIVRVCDPQVGWTGTDEELVEAKRDSEARGATHVHTGNWQDKDGERSYWLHEIGHKPWSRERQGLSDHEAPIRRWGKKTAGRELDGLTWDQFPEAVSSDGR